MNNVFVREIELPMTVEGVTVKDTNGDFNVYINSLLSPSKKAEALEHELRHIKFDHLYKETPVVEDENEANLVATIVPTLDICARLKELRLKAGLTSAQVAELAHIRTSLYVEMEKGIRKFNPDYENEVLTALERYCR